MAKKKSLFLLVCKHGGHRRKFYMPFPWSSKIATRFACHAPRAAPNNEIEGAAWCGAQIAEGRMDTDTDQAKQAFHVTLDQRMTELQITDEALGVLLGYQKPSVIALMRTGQMRMPLQKVQPLAQALDLPAREILEALMQESMPEALAVMRAVYDPMVLAPAEINLIKYLRRDAQGEPYTPIIMSGKSVIALVTSTGAK